MGEAVVRETKRDASCEGRVEWTNGRARISPAYAGSHGCQSFAVVCDGVWIKPWGSTTHQYCTSYDELPRVVNGG